MARDSFKRELAAMPKEVQKEIKRQLKAKEKQSRENAEIALRSKKPIEQFNTKSLNEMSFIEALKESAKQIK